VSYNPRATRYDDLSIGREGSSTIARIKCDSCYYDKILEADYFTIKGVKYELNRPPVIKTFGGVRTVVEFFVEAIEFGQRMST